MKKGKLVGLAVIMVMLFSAQNGGAYTLESTWIYDNGNNEDAVDIVVTPSREAYTAVKYGMSPNAQYIVNKHYSNGAIINTIPFNNGVAESTIKAISTDAEGNLYIVGIVNNGVDQDCLTAKYSADGLLAWQNTYDSGQDETCKDIAVDTNGAVYITGRGPSNNGMTDQTRLLIKYDSAGTLVFSPTALGFVGSVIDSSDIVVDDSGNIYTLSIQSSNQKIDKLDPNGAYSETIYSVNGFGAVGMEMDKNGNIVVAGTILGANDNNDYHIVRIDPTGAMICQQDFDSGFAETAVDLAVDGYGDAYITGDVAVDSYQTVKFDTSCQQMLSDPLVWNQTASSYDHAKAIAVDNQANIYVNGMTTDLILPDLSMQQNVGTIKYSGGVIPYDERKGACGDGMDNDLDGDVDCADSGCNHPKYCNQ